jgi:hypothetical protein
MSKGKDSPVRVRECVHRISKKHKISVQMCLDILSRDFPDVRAKYQQNADLISIIPDEMKLEVALKMPVKNLMALATTSKDWKEFLSDQMLWKKLYERDFGTAHQDVDVPDYKALYKNRSFENVPSKKWMMAVFLTSSAKKKLYSRATLFPPGYSPNEFVSKTELPILIAPVDMRYTDKQVYNGGKYGGTKEMYIAVSLGQLEALKQEGPINLKQAAERKARLSPLFLRRADAEKWIKGRSHLNVARYVITVWPKSRKPDVSK